MKAQLKPVKVWMPHKDEDIKDMEDNKFAGAMRVYVGSLHVGWAVPTATEPEELFKLQANKLLIYMDWNDTLELTKIDKKGRPLQVILDNVELVCKEFLNKMCK